MSKNYNEIMRFLKLGKENAVSRKELCVLTGYSDRRNRRLIAEAGKAGHIIVSSSHTKGYYIGTTEEDYRIIAREGLHRIGEIYKRIKPALTAMKKNPAQFTLEEANYVAFTSRWVGTKKS